MTTTDTAPAFRLSLAPASVTLHKLTHYSGSVKVTDSGKVPVNVSMHAVSLGASGASCTASHSAPSWLHLAARSFQLQPGQARTVSYTVSAPAGTTGSGAVVAMGKPVHPGHGNAQLSGAIGSRITLGTDACTVQHAAAPPSHSGGFPAGAVIVPLLLLAVIVALVLAVRRRRAAR